MFHFTWTEYSQRLGAAAPAPRGAGTWENYRGLATACEYLALVGAKLVVEAGWFSVETPSGWQTAETVDDLVRLAFGLVAEHPQHGLVWRQPEHTSCANCGTVDHGGYECPCGCHEGER